MAGGPVFFRVTVVGVAVFGLRLLGLQFSGYGCCYILSGGSWGALAYTYVPGVSDPTPGGLWVIGPKFCPRTCYKLHLFRSVVTSFSFFVLPPASLIYEHRAHVWGYATCSDVKTHFQRKKPTGSSYVVHTCSRACSSSRGFFAPPLKTARSSGDGGKMGTVGSSPSLRFSKDSVGPSKIGRCSGGPASSRAGSPSSSVSCHPPGLAGAARGSRLLTQAR